MLNDPKVLIIEADPENAKELCVILKFINYTPVVVEDCLQWRQTAEGIPDLLTVMVGTCQADNGLGELLEGHAHTVAGLEDPHLQIGLHAAVSIIRMSLHDLDHLRLQARWHGA